MRLMTELPAWLRPGRDLSHVSNTRRFARTQRYFTQMLAATPAWLTPQQRRQFYGVYRDMRRQRRAGRNVQVDHIVPLLSPAVCGLNVPWNLQIIDASANGSKSNRYWPGCPWENADLFDAAPPEPHQLRLF